MELITQHSANTDSKNTERELTVSPACPDYYKSLAVELSGVLAQEGDPPSIFSSSRDDRVVLIETTSGKAIALRSKLPDRSSASGTGMSAPVALLLPKACDLSAWFRAFLFDLHESDPGRIPQAPPRLSQPSDWYTPQERSLARNISQLESKIERLRSEQLQLQSELATETEKADRDIRQTLWASGDDLTLGVQNMLEELGFSVLNMDEEIKDGDPKREDLRLTLGGQHGWEGMVEVKGYTSGTRTNDARQIREHRDKYIQEQGCPPALTLWISNPYRSMEPSSRPAPDRNVKNAAEAVGAVYVLVTDLYRQWALVTADILDADVIASKLDERRTRRVGATRTRAS